ncbi:hypothetical protein NQ314_013884 [Rhamnusium bicolor]|uniref:PiggyBac transposable element-derived protein domain-containing protein n=1 Tax=Rhamnusium bicolor TaxID=1586634 RepID=A0AAV8X6V4_9CUCU|nr:hypothetical protein NQ314_013884 [Rhamnusium bicolor]
MPYIKIFALCGTSGQVFDSIIYQGSTTELDPAMLTTFGHGALVVPKLAERINEKNVLLIFDNYFSNYNLLQYLRNKNIYAMCTTRQNRFNKPPISSDKDMKNLGRGSTDHLISENGEVIITKWYDNKPVVLASNFLGSGKKDVCKRWDKTKKKYVEIERPEVIRVYNQHIEGVDKIDFLITIYRTFIRSKNWTPHVCSYNRFSMYKCLDGVQEKIIAISCS